MDVTEKARQESLKLRFEKPSGWSFQKTEEWSCLFEIAGGESARISLIARASFDKSLDDFSQIVADGIKLTHPGSTILNHQERQMLGYPAQQRIFTLSGAPENEQRMLALISTVDKEIAFLLFYSAGEPEFFEKMNAFEEVARTLSFEQETGLDPFIRRQVLVQEYLQAGRWEGAIRELEEMRNLRPDHPEVQSQLAYLYSVVGNANFVQQGDLAGAEEMFQRSLELNADQPEVRKTLRLIQASKKEVQ